MDVIRKLEGRTSDPIEPVTPVQVVLNLQSTISQSASKKGIERHVVNKGRIKGTHASTNTSKDSPTQLSSNNYLVNRAKGSFQTRIEELREYKRLHGHCNVQFRNNASLCKWSNKIRSSYSKYCQGEQTTGIKLTQDRIDILESTGFDFESSASKEASSSKSNESVDQTRTKKAAPQVIQNTEDDFEEHMEESVSSNSTSEDTRASTNTSKDAPTQLSSNHNLVKRGEEFFKKHIEELREYKRLHGHCNVQRHLDHPSLYLWSNKIRSSYSRYCQGEQNTVIKLTQYRIDILESAGFDFEFSASKEASSRKSNESVAQTRTKNVTRQVTHNKEDSFEVSKGRSNASVVQTRMKKTTRKVRESAEDSFEASSKSRSNESVAETSTKKALRLVSENAENSFEEHMDELNQYSQQHGHCDVRRSDNNELYRWCQNVRSSYPKHFLGEKMDVQLCEDRIQALFLIGFNFAPLRSRHGADNAVAESCERPAPKSATSLPLKRKEISSESIPSKRRRKDCVKRPPPKSDWSPISPLLNTRLNYSVEHKINQEGLRKCSSSASANSSFSQEQASESSSNKLSAIDSLGGVKRRRRGDASFQARVEELTRYKKKNGHCDVKRLDDRSLYEWCQNVRSSYANYLEGDGKIEIQLTDERVQALQTLGFEMEEGITKRSLRSN